MENEQNQNEQKSQKNQELQKLVILGTEPTEPFLRTLAKREKTRGGLSWLLTGTLCLTIIVYIALTILTPTRVDGVAFERIWFVLSPLVGMSVTHYFTKG